MKYDDTIVAISTPVGTGGIGIIRVSGSEAINIVNKSCDKNLLKVESHTINYGHILDDERAVIDEVLIMLMKAPKTFTRENIVEINCHGGVIVLNKVLMQIIKNGARLAENGEFTKRAFLNGRIDLSQVEAVMDIIEAKTELSLTQAINQLDGKLSHKIKMYQQELLEIIAKIEVSIDYPEYDEDLSVRFEADVKRLCSNLKVLLQTADTGQIIRDGVKAVIIGEPNVGKSSLLNILLEQNKAIVTDVAGTTRDSIEVYFNIEGVPFILFDTAGIRDTVDTVEKIGVMRSKQLVEQADLVIMVMDSQKKVSNNEKDILQSIKDKKVIYVQNKIDLGQSNILSDDDIQISTVTGDGIEKLKQVMKDTVMNKGISIEGSISNIRQKQALVNAIQSLDKAYAAIKISMPEDLIVIDLHESYGHLGMIIGETLKEEIINELFEKFCLGK
ncbi:MAG: tRNA uridine-5-carboxymethylaminomethyl(34) synthesis GTPase MnmE [Epulopiscium sp. Nuni2H_MBin001]|nr:MAG: tRNA uridine-5-carboxymethylaminomethyl(34) synthesis GTPase MnmE [Epulopiscium sp. Nuni2H_MBin001]